MISSGVILINKPKDLTSHDVVDVLRKITGIQCIGHTGTLDPFSTGLLILLIGKSATVLQSKFLKLDKTYWGKIRLDAISDTYDLTGKIKEMKIDQMPSFEKIQEIKNQFIGVLIQTPPQFSAKKIKGKKAYELAREGKIVELKPQKIKIHSLEIIKYDWPYLEIRAKVSSGTYLRSLAHDIGRWLGVGGMLEALKRESIGDYKLEQAIDLNQLTSENWRDYLIDLGLTDEIKKV